MLHDHISMATVEENGILRMSMFVQHTVTYDIEHGIDEKKRVVYACKN